MGVVLNRPLKRQLAELNETFARGPLAGVPITIKVNADQKGFATTNGLRLQKDLIAQQDDLLTSDLFFDSTVQQRVSYTTPFRTIFFDTDGTLTDKGANSWFLPYWKHLLVDECTDEPALGGITCDSSV